MLKAISTLIGQIASLTNATVPLAGTETVPIDQSGAKKVTVANLTKGRTIQTTGINDNNNNEVVTITTTGSAVNEFTVANAATGAGPTLSATGSDTNIAINLTPKGTGGVVFPAGAVGTPAITTSGNTNTGIFFPAADVVAVGVGGSEGMRLTSTGLGIGTSNPLMALEVRGAQTVSGDSRRIIFAVDTSTSAQNVGAGIAFAGRINAGGTVGTLGSVAGLKENAVDGDQKGYLSFVLNSGTGTQTERMRLNSSGNLGIGTNLPDALLTVNTVASFGAGAVGAPSIAAKGDLDTGMWFPAANTLAWSTGGSERARIDSSGNFLVGTTSLTVPIDSSTSEGFIYENGFYIAVGRASGTTAIFNRKVDDGAVVNLRSRGVDVGTISVTSTATAYNTSSDYRLKDNPQPLTNAGAFIDALKPKTWNWKADGSKGVGFIAHEVQEVSPSSVSGEKDGEEMQCMEYGSGEFIANIIAELQSLRKRVAKLEAR